MKQRLGYANPFVLSARPAGRAGNPRAGAFSGVSPTAGLRAAGGPENPFENRHVPMLWDALIPEFGRAVDYWLDGDDGQAASIVVIWKEGAEDEDTSPGRYSHALVKHCDLERPPRLGDIVSHAGATYDVVRVDAYRYAVSTIVLQDRRI